MRKKDVAGDWTTLLARRAPTIKCGPSMRAVKDSPATRLFPLEDRRSERGEDRRLTSTARGTRTMKQCSFDTRSEGATWPPSCEYAFRSE